MRRRSLSECRYVQLSRTPSPGREHRRYPVHQGVEDCLGLWSRWAPDLTEAVVAAGRLSFFSGAPDASGSRGGYGRLDGASGGQQARSGDLAQQREESGSPWETRLRMPVPRPAAGVALGQPAGFDPRGNFLGDGPHGALVWPSSRRCPVVAGVRPWTPGSGAAPRGQRCEERLGAGAD